MQDSVYRVLRKPGCVTLLERFLLDPRGGFIWSNIWEEGETEIGTGFLQGIGYSRRVNGLTLSRVYQKARSGFGAGFSCVDRNPTQIRRESIAQVEAFCV